MKNRKLQIFDIRRKAVFSDKEKAPSIYINSLNYKMAKCFKLIGYLKSIKTLFDIHLYFYTFVWNRNPFFHETTTEAEAKSKRPAKTRKQRNICPEETSPVNRANKIILNSSPIERNRLSTRPMISFGILSIKNEFLATLEPLFPIAIKNIKAKYPGMLV